MGDAMCIRFSGEFTNCQTIALASQIQLGLALTREPWLDGVAAINLCNVYAH